jgi:conjugal transfer/entry exclusion protein
MAYSKQQFEAGFQLITAVSHQIIKIDFKEIEIWIDKMMGAKALTDETAKENMQNLKAVMSNFGQMQQVLMQRGVPVRDISNYKENIIEVGPNENNPDPKQ